MLRTALAFVWLAALSAAANAADLYVSPAGDDRHSGRGPEPARAMRTLQAAANRLQPGDRLLVRGGVYRETVVFPRGGSAGKPIVLMPYAGEKVTVSGCDPVTGWNRGDRGVWQAPMRWTLGAGRNQVFARGRVLVEARYPNAPAPGLELPVKDLSPLWPTFGEFSIPKESAAAQPGRIVSTLLDGQPDDYWKGALYYGVHYEGWCGQTGVVESSKSGEILVGDRTQGWWFPSAYGVNGSEDGRGMIVGHLHALDAPGEWVWQDGALHLMPIGSGPPTGIEAKRRNLAFDLSGRSHIRISGIRVTAASVRLLDSAFCTFDRCDFTYVSHYLRQYNMGEIERGQDNIKSGETGIFVGGHNNAFTNCSVRFSAGAGFHLRGYHHTIHNCLIDEVSYTGHYLNAITDAVGDYNDYENFLVGGHAITYNTMRNAGRHFLNFYGNGTSTASRTRSGMDYRATLFAHNHLYNGMLQTRDAGFITAYYCSAGTLNGQNSQVAFNVIHDCYDLSAIRWGILGPIYLDAGTANVDVRNNLLWAAPGALQKGVWFNTCCANCVDVDNVFHRYFRRTSAQLTAADFPNGKPFRFGHDFAVPPPGPKWPPIVSRGVALGSCTSGSASVRITPSGIENLRDGDWVALPALGGTRSWDSVVMSFASADKGMNSDRGGRSKPRHRNATDPLVLEVDARDGASPGIGAQWTFINNVRDGAWIRFSKVPLGSGYQSIRLVYGKVTDSPASVEVRLDSPDGPIVATCPLRKTDRPRGGSIQIYAEAVEPVSEEARGEHDVYLVFRGADATATVGEFEYARFEEYRGDIALAPNEVKIEVRDGARDGRLVGVLYPRYTGGAAQVRELVAPLRGTNPNDQLYLVVRSAASGPIGRISGLRFEQSAPGGVRPALAIGSGPRKDARGRMVLPAQTNRPRYQPPAVVPGAGIPRAGLAAWFDASDAASVRRDAVGRVAEWRDRSGRGRHASQQDPSFKPVYEAKALEGKPALRFSEKTSTRLEAPDLAPGKISATAFAVISNPELGSPVNHNPRVFTASDGTEFDYMVGIALSPPNMEIGGPRLISGVYPDRWAKMVRIGCFSPVYQTYFTGLVSEIIVYDRALSADEMEIVRAYLTRKWGLKG